MQAEVQYLIEKVKGFDSYFTNKCDRYEKYTALLVKDGYFALSTFLDKEVKKDGRDLCNILDDNKDSFRRDLTSKQLDVLYPSTKGSAQLDPSTWDVGLLATVILNIFGNSIARLARKLIKYIGDASQDYAEKAIIALDGNKFEKISTELRTKILILSEYIDEETANRCEMILDECEASDAFKTNMDMLKTQDTLMKSFTDIQEETLQRTKKCLQEMITNGISFGQSHELDLKMITLGTDEENKKFAEEVLTDIWKESLDRSKETEIFPEVKKEVSKILEEIKKGKNAKSFSIEMGSIILRISFKTPREMLSTIHYFESRSFQEAIGNIAEGLGYYFNTAFAVFTVMPIDSLWGILNPQSSLARAQEYGIRLSISVSSPADMLQLRSLIVSEKIAKSTQYTVYFRSFIGSFFWKNNCESQS
ncbi:uncharacterized protein LOC123558629 [Mercenaria mercenaria]|uniref:uncharacterized protein LOC123558629 n=1 Tax=Mercenaria mercenaria TaxID=6596 RepID=UPI00234F7955|nr:uncharacterized protein LOC123558629 [Mercenaria mercenaria]